MNRPQSNIVCAVVAILCIASAGCDYTGTSSSATAARGGPSPADAGKINVVCTTTMITDLARKIAGDLATIQGIMKEGEDPHVYDVRPRDAQMIAKADVVLTNGLHLEATLGHVIEHNASGALVKPLAESPKIKTLGSTTMAGAPDPHCWMNVQYFMVYLEGALEALVQADPDNAEAYRANAAAYRSKLEKLDAWVEQQIGSIPRKQRVMVTSHDAFEYLGARYGIDVLAVIGISTEQQPRPQDVVALENSVRDRGVRALFIETSVTATLNDIVKKVAAKTGARIGGTLYSDSLGEEGTEVGTYLGMMKHNISTIADALK